MKKTKILGLLAALLAVVMLFSSCGATISTATSYAKVLNKDYDPTAPLLTKAEALSELEGYTMVEDVEDDYFALFAKASDDLTSVTYKVFCYRSSTVVLTLTSSENTAYDIALYNDMPVIYVTKTVTNEEAEDEDDKITHSYTLYNTKGEEVATATEDDAYGAPYCVAEKVIYKYTAYDIQDDDTLAAGVTIPEWVIMDDCIDWTDDYIYTVDEGEAVLVYNNKFEFVSAYTFPSFAEDVMYFVLNNGNVLVQYDVQLDPYAEEYDYYEITELGATEKYDLVAEIFAPKTGKVTAKNNDFVVAYVMASRDMYDETEDNNYYTDKFENIAYIFPIIDKKVDTSEINMDLVLMDNNGKATKSLKIADGQKAVLPTKIADDKYIVATVYGYAMVTLKGKTIVSFNNDMEFAGGYIVGERAVYNLDMELVYDLVANKAEVLGSIGNTLFLQAGEEDKYQVLALRDGTTTTICSYDAENETNTLFSVEDEMVYCLYNEASNEYEYFNGAGTSLIKTTYELEIVGYSAVAKTILFAGQNDAGADVYYLFSAEAEA